MGDNPGDCSIPVYHGVRGHRAGSGDVMRLDARRKGSNRMGDEDGRRYNDQVLTDGPFGP